MMATEKEEDRELRKEIAAPPKNEGTIFSKSLQFFVVPLGIVVICVGIYLLFTYLARGPQRSTRDIVIDLRDSGVKARAQAALELAEVLRRTKPEDLRRSSPTLVKDLIETYRAVPPDPPVTDVLAAGAGINIRILVIECLGLMGDNEAAPFLLEEAKGGKEELRPYAIRALGICGDAEVVPDVIAMLDSPSPSIRKFAANALGALRDRRAVDALKAKLGDSQPDVQWNAACALGFYFSDPSAAPVLRGMLDRTTVAKAVGTDSYARDLVAAAMVNAMNAVVALKDRSFEDVLKGLSKDDPDMKVRMAASQALSHLGK